MTATILVIEDQAWVHNMYKKELAEHKNITIVSAFTLQQGYEAFSQVLPTIVVMDGCVDNEDKIDSLGIIQFIRSKYDGHMIAASSSSSYRALMMKTGCNHQCPKEHVSELILELLAT